MDAANSHLDVSHLPSNFITMILQSISLSDRFTCALVCKAWAEAATTATRSIILRDEVQDLSCLQRWLQKHGGQVAILQLHECRHTDVLTALPCPQLQDLLLRGGLSLDSRVWSDLAAATKLTSVSLELVATASQQADVVSALTALPNLEQLTCRRIRCGWQRGLPDSKLPQKLTNLTALRLVSVFDSVWTESVLEHLGLLTRLHDLNVCVEDKWAAAGCPGLQELKALTRLKLRWCLIDIPPTISQLTALQQLKVPGATPTALNQLSELTGLTRLRVDTLTGLSHRSPPLQLPGLQTLKVVHGMDGIMPMSFLATCTQLQVLKLCRIYISGPGSLVTSSMLQRLELRRCRVSAADGAADPVPWQQVFPGPGRLPHLTSLQMKDLEPALQHDDMEWVVSCCSNLQVLHIPQGSVTSALTRLPGLTSLTLWSASDRQCSSLAQLTGLRELRVDNASQVFAAGLQQLAVLEQLTSLGLNYLGWSSDVLRVHMSDRLPGHVAYKHALLNQVCVCLAEAGFALRM